MVPLDSGHRYGRPAHSHCIPLELSPTSTARIKSIRLDIGLYGHGREYPLHFVDFGGSHPLLARPQYDDVAAAARCLLWLAGDYRRAWLEGAGDRLQGPVPAGTGFQNERCGSDLFDFRWQGKRVRADWHVRNGGNTRDPAHCLRIYYCWHQGEGRRVLVGEMPSHVRSRMS